MISSNQTIVDNHDDKQTARTVGEVILGTGAMLACAGFPASASIMETSTNHHVQWVEKSNHRNRRLVISPSDTYNHIGMEFSCEPYLSPRRLPTARSTSNASIVLLSRSLSQLRTDKSHALATLIQSYSSLNLGWDGEDAEPLSQDTINEGLSFIELFFNFSTTKPHVSPAGDGELSFAWKTENDYLEASFYGDGNLYWYSDIKGNKETDTFEFSRKSIPRLLMDKILNFDEH